MPKAKIYAIAESVPPEGLIDVKQVMCLIGMGKSWIYGHMEPKGDFPAPVKFGKRATRWNVQKVREWIAKQNLQQEV